MSLTNENKFNSYRNFLEIDLNAIKYNGKIAKSQFADKKIMSVLKADAYGHGIDGVVKAYEDFSDWYAVATVEEGLRIRNLSNKPVLIFGSVPSEKIFVAAKNNLTFTVGSVEYAKQLNSKMESVGMECRCQLKIDTGLNRSGIRWFADNDGIDEVKKINNCTQLNFVGTYTHFACGEGMLDWEQEFTSLQFERFINAIDAMKSCGISMGICHCCSTGGSLVHPEYQMDMVRVGMLPLGMSYSDESVSQLGLKPVARWISYITQTKNVYKGEPVSYGCTFIAHKDMKIALVACGYADGYRRIYSNKASVLVQGERVRVIGRIAMDYLIIDITDIQDISIGTEVVLLGVDGIENISAQQLSQWGESVSGEVTCAISSRVPRIYK